MQNELLAIDPGNDQGWAILKISDRALLRCGLGHPAKEVFEAVFLECPQIYRNSEASPKDIIKLAVRCGIQVDRFAESPAYLVSPHDWKGSVPKKINVGRVLSRLSPAELEIYGKVKCAAGKRHNVADAIGLGKWALDNRGMWSMLHFGG